MKKFMLASMALGLIAMSSLCVAAPRYISSKSSPAINAMAAAWKTQEAVRKRISKPDNHMIYGGSDLSPKTTLIAPTVTA